MGQGVYTAIVWGVIDPPTEVDVDGYSEPSGWYQVASDLAGKRRSVHFDSSYEAEPFYRGITIAVSDRCLATTWEVPLLDRNVMPADRLLDWVSANALHVFDLAVAAWEDVRVAGHENGVEVPEGRLLLVWDWD